MTTDFIFWLQEQPKDKQFWIVAGFIGTFAVLILLSHLWEKYKEKRDE